MASGDMITTIVGNLGDDPELRFLPTGVAVCNASVASTPRRLNRDTNTWEDGDTTWVRLNMWREMAEHAAETLTKGMRVIVTGTLTNRKWTDNDGNDRWSLEMRVDEVGPALRYATAKVTKTSKGGGGPQPPPPDDPWSRQAQPAGARPGGDPWASAVPAGQPDEPPY